MASISIHDLRPTGADFFTDAESYMHELSDAELSQQGGMTPTTWTSITITILLQQC